MRKFEYTIENVFGGPEDTDNHKLYYLNKLGEEGWEAVCKIKKWYNNDRIEGNWPIYSMLFKREKL